MYSYFSEDFLFRTSLRALAYRRLPYVTIVHSCPNLTIVYIRTFDVHAARLILKYYQRQIYLSLCSDGNIGPNENLKHKQE